MKLTRFNCAAYQKSLFGEILRADVNNNNLKLVFLCSYCQTKLTYSDQHLPIINFFFKNKIREVLFYSLIGGMMSAAAFFLGRTSIIIISLVIIFYFFIFLLSKKQAYQLFE